MYDGLDRAGPRTPCRGGTGIVAAVQVRLLNLEYAEDHALPSGAFWVGYASWPDVINDGAAATVVPGEGRAAMGDWFQTIVDVEAGAEDADRLAAGVRDWLISVGVVLAERTDCVLGAEVGHPPGPAAGQALEDPSSDDGWQGLWSNGLDISVGRRIFDAGQGDVEAVTCPHCMGEIRLVDDGWELIDEAWAPFREVLTDWPEGYDGVIACPSCDQPVEPTAWRWADDYFALGHLGFTFWNWPPLKQDFIAEVGRRLGGHRTVLMAGKL